MLAKSNNEPSTSRDSAPAPQLSLLRMQQMRKQIDSIDNELSQLLLQRLEIAQTLGKLKTELGLPFHDPVREESVLKKVASEAEHSPLQAHIVKLYKAIMEESCTIQRNIE